jgi:ribosomal protein S6--L-glutamate ligase/gamma-F420-2:alpha-L-glutamate ligase
MLIFKKARFGQKLKQERAKRRKMKGCIITNAFYKADEYLYQARRMCEEFTKAGVEADIVSNAVFPVCVSDGEVRTKFDGYDFFVFWDKDKYVLEALSLLNKPIFNSPRAIETCDDKMLTYLALSGVAPLIDTIPGALCFDPRQVLPSEEFDLIEQKLGYPVVVKESFGSGGKGVFLARDREELKTIADKVKNKPHLFQKFIDESAGVDLRVIVIGGKVLGGMLRRGADFRSNVGAGGKGEKYDVSPDIVAVAEKIAARLSLDYCGIDFLLTKSGFYVCEVNSNAFFVAFESVTAHNVAAAYAEHILRKIRG